MFTKNATLDGVQGNLSAERIELFLAAKDNALDRLEAQDAVKVMLDKREATGQRMTYHPSDEQYVLTGSPGAPGARVPGDHRPHVDLLQGVR